MAALSLAGGCGGKHGRDGEGREELEVTGTVTLRGSSPFPLVTIVTADGSLYLIQSSDLSDELRHLDGMKVAVTGRITEVKGESPILSVEWYDILPLPSGQRPIVGHIYGSPPDRALLIDRDGTRYEITGDFTMVLADFDGAKVWVVGDVEFSRIQLQVRTINVTEYGILRPGGGGIRIE